MGEPIDAGMCGKKQTLDEFHGLFSHGIFGSQFSLLIKAFFFLFFLYTYEQIRIGLTRLDPTVI